MAIVKSILEAEKGSSLNFDRSNIYNKMNIERFENTWFVKFARMLTRNRYREGRASVFDKISFIVFNYDRCLEFFLLHAIAQVYSISVEEAGQIMPSLVAIHPYGIAAPAPYEPRGLAFGGRPTDAAYTIMELAKGIRTYSGTRARTTSNSCSESRRLIKSSFWDLPFTIKTSALLKPKARTLRRNLFMAPQKECRTMTCLWSRRRLLGFFRQNDHTAMSSSGRMQIRNDLTCSELFSAYSKSLPA